MSMVVISGRIESTKDHSEVPSRSGSSLESTRDYTEVLSTSNSRLEDIRDRTLVTVDPTEDSIPDPWSLVGDTDLQVFSGRQNHH